MLWWRELWVSDRGATMVEYALIVAGIAVVSITVLGVLGHEVTMELRRFLRAMR